VNKLFSFFKSVKLAVVLILYITAASILASLVPQGRELAFYYHTYPQPLAFLIDKTGFDHFFTSLLFLAPAALFFVNLLVCTVDRLTREIKKKVKRRFGPDLIHIGLLVLVIGSVISFTGKKEGFVYLGEGDQVTLPGEYVLTLESFDFQIYEDGRPKDWISTVDVKKNDEKLVDSFPIEVNNPLKIGKIKIYQSSYSREEQLVLTTPDGEERQVRARQPIMTEEAAYLFRGFARNSETGEIEHAVVEKWQNQQVTDTLRVTEGGSFDGFTVNKLSTRQVTGLQAKIDPGFVPVLIGLIIAGCGLGWTYIQKARENAL
jgi:cytochrome c biogenesis protein